MRGLIASIALGVCVALVAIGTYHALEWILRDYADYDRGVWEGAALVSVVHVCTNLGRRVLNRGRKGT